MDAVKEKHGKLSRHITVRLMGVFILAIVPLLILIFMVFSQIVATYTDKLNGSYQNQLEIYCTGINSKLDYIESAIADYFDPAQIYLMTNGTTESNEIALVNINKDLKAMRGAMGIRALSFVRDNKTGMCGVSNSPYSYSIRELQTVRDCILSDTEHTAQATGLVPFYTPDGVFLSYWYNYSRFSLGILIDADALIRDFGAYTDSVTQGLYIADTKDQIIAGGASDDATIAKAAEQNESILLTKQLGYSGYKFVWVLSRSELNRQVSGNILPLILVTLLALLALPVIWLAIRHYVLNPLEKLFVAMNTVEEGEIETRLTEGGTGTFQMDYIFLHFNRMMEEIKHLTIESYELQIAKIQTDAVNLKLQVRPHMLLNSLNTIYNLAKANRSELAANFSLYLIKYFRFILRKGEALVTVGEEIAFVKNYLSMQTYRFPNSFAERCTVEPGAEAVRIPPFIIENFIENSVKYALVMGSTIEIGTDVRISDDRLVINVWDTGIGIDEEKLKKLSEGAIVKDDLGDHIGIWNCRRRLKLYYGEAARLSIESAPEAGTRIRMELPLVAREIQENLNLGQTGEGTADA